MAVYGPVRHPKNIICPVRHQKNIICPYNIFLVTDRSIYCHMTLSAMNYFLYNKNVGINFSAHDAFLE